MSGSVEKKEWDGSTWVVLIIAIILIVLLSTICKWFNALARAIGDKLAWVIVSIVIAILVIALLVLLANNPEAIPQLIDGTARLVGGAIETVGAATAKVAGSVAKEIIPTFTPILLLAGAGFVLYRFLLMEMKKIRIGSIRLSDNREHNVYQTFSVLRYSELIDYAKLLISGLKNANNRPKLEAFTHNLRKSELSKIESFIVMPDDYSVEQPLENYNLKIEEGLVERFSKILSMLLKNNKSQTNYSDLHIQRNSLIQSLEEAMVGTNKIESKVSWHQITIDSTSRLYVTNASNLILARNLSLEPSGFASRLKLKDCVKEKRSLDGRLYTDVYRHQYGDLMDKYLYELELNNLTDIINDEVVSLIEIFPRVEELEQTLFKGIEFMNALLAAAYSRISALGIENNIKLETIYGVYKALDANYSLVLEHA